MIDYLLVRLSPKQISVLVAALLLAVLAAVVAERWFRDPASPSLASGVALAQLLDCEGQPLRVGDGHVASGTAFLIGRRVLMTAEHGVIPIEAGNACGLRVRLDGAWHNVTSIRIWHTRDEDGRGIDLATLEIPEDVQGHMFSFSKGDEPLGSAINALGYPLGGPLETTEGELTRRLRDYGIPTLSARIEIEGGDSGGPLLNSRNEVMSVVSRLVIGANLTTDHKSRWGGVDLATWWGDSMLNDLCAAHPRGGIKGCGPGEAPAKKSFVVMPTYP